jgi:hypothetical protein
VQRFRPRLVDALADHDRRTALADVNEQPLSLMRRSGFAAELGEEQIVPTVCAVFSGASGAPENVPD